VGKLLMNGSISIDEHGCPLRKHGGYYLVLPCWHCCCILCRLGTIVLRKAQRHAFSPGGSRRQGGRNGRGIQYESRGSGIAVLESRRDGVCQWAGAILSHTEWVQEIRAEFIGFAWRSGRHAWGFHAYSHNVGDIEYGKGFQDSPGNIWRP